MGLLGIGRRAISMGESCRESLADGFSGGDGRHRIQCVCDGAAHSCATCGCKAESIDMNWLRRQAEEPRRAIWTLFALALSIRLIVMWAGGYESIIEDERDYWRGAHGY